MAAEVTTQSSPPLPPLTTPHFSGGKLASIRQKIDERQLLLAGGVPPQMLKNLNLDPAPAPDSTDLHENIADNLAGSYRIANDLSKKSTPPPHSPSTLPSAKKDDLADEDEKNPALCSFCGRTYPSERIERHRQICGAFAEKLKKVPFIVMLGLRQVDGERNKEVATVPANNAVENCKQVNEVEELEHEDLEIMEAEEGEEEEKEYDVEEGDENNEEMILCDGKLTETTPSMAPQYPGGGNNWTKEHERYMSSLQEVRQTMELFASGNFPGLPPPPGPNEFEVDYVQCPNCLRRFARHYNAPDHLARCKTRRTFL